MNGFYTCLLGNIVTTIALQHGGTYAGCGVMLLVAVAAAWSERSHVTAWLAHKVKR